ncbi:MAG TPA: porphobilinogen synthase [Candidatus Nitrosopolaris rasttigaisensis]|jgi:porphobilinogen synthase|nr:porphobilinogen synthase [Candidatus Nitrosopolaris rasttigaisensis]
MKIGSCDCTAGYPVVRLRRLRTTPAIRDLLQETHLSVKDLISPIFVQERITKREPIQSMPGIERIPPSEIIDEVQAVLDLGVRAIMLFGIPFYKNKRAGSAFLGHGVVQDSVRVVRKHFGNRVAIITDVCLCQYTTHGHCGIVVKGKVDNDKSVRTLAKVATSHAEAGTDMVAPSAMMDGQVKSIREGLDENGFEDVAIISYSAKHASPLYGPFRDIACSRPQFGDRRTYQMSFTNPREAMHEIEVDIREGADIIMIKPAIPYLDLIYQAKKNTNLPICAYSVSGEYALIKAAAGKGLIDEDSAMTESLTSIKRAGADLIITYYAKKMATLLNE